MLQSLANAAGEAVQEAWEEGGKFEHVLSIAGETYVDYAAIEGRAAPLPDYAKLLRLGQPAHSKEFADAIGGLRPGRTAGYERVYPDRDPAARPDSPTDLYTERPIDDIHRQTDPLLGSYLDYVDLRQVPEPVDVGTAGSASASYSVRAGPATSARSHKEVPARSEVRSQAAREQAERDNERDALSAKAAYQSEINAVRRNVAADRAARQAAERRMQVATRQAEQLKQAEEAAAAAAAAVQRELIVERQLRAKAEARARVLSQKVAAASKAKARTAANAKAQEREKMQAAQLATHQGSKGRAKVNVRDTRACEDRPQGKHQPDECQTPDDERVRSLSQAYVALSDDELTWAAPRVPAVREIQAIIPTATTRSVAADEEARQMSARPSAERSAQAERTKLRQSGSASSDRVSRKPSVSTEFQPQEPVPRSASRARQRAAEQEARTIERLRASKQNRASLKADYEYMPEGPPQKKVAKKKAKKWPKPRPVKSRPAPDWAAIPAKVSTHADKSATETATGPYREQFSLPASERLMRRALEQEERTVTRLRKNQRNGGVEGGSAENCRKKRSSEQQQQQDRRRQHQNRGMPTQRNFLTRGKIEERLAAQADDARRRATRYKNAVSRLSSIAQAVDDLEREQAAERQRMAREKDNGVNSRDHWRTAGPVRLDPDGCIILEGPETEPIRPRARSAPARSRPAHATSSGHDMAAGPPKNTSPPGYVKRMQQRELKAKASRPGEGGIHAWKQSLRESESQAGEPALGVRTNWLRKGGGRRALDGKVYDSESHPRQQPEFDGEDKELAAVLPGKVKNQAGLAAKWAHVPSRIRGQKPWQGRPPTSQLAATEDMLDEDGLPLIDIMFEVGSTPPPQSEYDKEEAEMRIAAEVFRDQRQPHASQEEAEDEQWARYAINAPTGGKNEACFVQHSVSCRATASATASALSCGLRVLLGAFLIVAASCGQKRSHFEHAVNSEEHPEHFDDDLQTEVRKALLGSRYFPSELRIATRLLKMLRRTLSRKISRRRFGTGH